MSRNHLEYWETLCPDADAEIDKFIRLLLEGKKTIKQVFERIHEIQNDTENFDADICKETINKVFDYVIENTDITEDKCLKAYHSIKVW